MAKQKFGLESHKIIILSVLSILLMLNYIPNQNFMDFGYSNDISPHKTLQKSSSESGGGYIMDTNAPYMWVEISKTGTELSDISEDNYASESLDLGALGDWNFTFYETEYSKIYISVNGWMSFTDTHPTYEYGHIPSLSEENRDCIALFWTNINTNDYNYGSGEVYYQFFGTSPNRYLVIEYFNVSIYDSDDSQIIGDFEVILFETGEIKFQYKNLNHLNISFYPEIGLDHGDLINYNNFYGFNDDFPVNSEAISFSFDQMEYIDYKTDIEIESEFSWIITQLNLPKMEELYGSDWYNQFGLPSASKRGMQIKTKIKGLEDGDTFYNITYDLYAWSFYDEIMPETPNYNDSLSYRQDPYESHLRHNLTNLIPFFLIQPCYKYLKAANLSSGFYSYISYDDKDYDDSSDYQLEISIEDYYVNDIYFQGSARYDVNGILEDYSLNWQRDDINERFTILELKTMDHKYKEKATLKIEEGDTHYYKINQINNTRLEQLFGTNYWEYNFGLPNNTKKNYLTKMEIDYVKSSESRFEIKCNLWEWKNRGGSFKSNPLFSPIIQYNSCCFKNGPNFVLPNIFPFFIPVSDLNYLKYSGLDSSIYDNIDLWYYGDTYISISLPSSEGELEGEAHYNEYGILEDYELIWDKDNDNKNEVLLFNIERSYPYSDYGISPLQQYLPIIISIISIGGTASILYILLKKAKPRGN